MTEKQYDITYLQNQAKLMKDGIENGNWEGYSENLAIRKQKYSELLKEIAEITGDEDQLTLF